MARNGGRVTVTADAGGLEDLAKMLRAMRLRRMDFRQVFSGPIDSSLDRFWAAMFATAGQAGGERWPALRASSVRWRARFGRNAAGPAAPLVDTGALRASLAGRGKGSYRRATKTTFERGTTDPLGALHQSGYVMSRWGRVAFSKKKGKPAKGLASRRRVPPRRVVPLRLPRYLVASWERALLDHVVKSGGNPGSYADRLGRPINRFGR